MATKSYSTQEAAKKLGVSPVRLRRYLRTQKKWNDEGYTRYNFTATDLKELASGLKNSKPAKSKPKKKGEAKGKKKKAKAPGKKKKEKKKAKPEKVKKKNRAKEDEEIDEII